MGGRSQGIPAGNQIRGENGVSPSHALVVRISLDELTAPGQEIPRDPENILFLQLSQLGFHRRCGVAAQISMNRPCSALCWVRWAWEKLADARAH
jgi:hypothetical protein